MTQQSQKAIILVKRWDVYAMEKVGDFDCTPEDYNAKIAKLRELLERCELERKEAH